MGLFGLLGFVQFVFALVVLCVGSVCDVKCREVSNRVWVFAYPVGCVLSGVGLVLGLVGVWEFVFSFGCSLVLGFGLFYFGFFGGADVKALIFVGLTVPACSIGFGGGLVSGGAVLVGLPLVLVMFLNSVFLSLVYPLAVFVVNVKDLLAGKSLFEGLVVSFSWKIRLLFTARKISLEELERNLAYFPLETIVIENGKPVRKVLGFVKAETDLARYLAVLRANEGLFEGGVLATPTIPFVVFFTCGLALAPWFNLTVWAVFTFLGVY